MASTKRKLTVYLDPDVARAARVYGARTDKRDSEVIEEALRHLLAVTALDEAQRLSMLTEDEASAVAREELHSYRRERSSH